MVMSGLAAGIVLGTLALSQAEAAQRLSESRHLRGKLVFEMR